MAESKLLNYQEILEKHQDRKHLLLGNGFSVGCNHVFNYPNLFLYAKQNGLPERICEVFEHFGTNNFEGVMRLLADSDWIANHYGFYETSAQQSALKSDLQILKNALVSAIAKTHLEYPSKVSDMAKASCVEFLKPYHNIFTTNYDLLLYWVSMFGQTVLREQDGFRASADYPAAEYLVFSEHVKQNRGILFLHGALHFYVLSGEVRKHSWVRTDRSLIELVKDGLAKDEYPLFVAEGKSHQKLEQIQRSGYLSYCLGKLERLSSPLVVYGLSLGESDQHIANVIADSDIPTLYLGVYSGLNSEGGKAIQLVGQNMKMRRQAQGRKIEVHYYDSKTVKIWN